MRKIAKEESLVMNRLLTEHPEINFNILAMDRDADKFLKSVQKDMDLSYKFSVSVLWYDYEDQYMEGSEDEGTQYYVGQDGRQTEPNWYDIDSPYASDLPLPDMPEGDEITDEEDEQYYEEATELIFNRSIKDYLKTSAKEGANNYFYTGKYHSVSQHEPTTWYLIHPEFYEVEGRPKDYVESPYEIFIEITKVKGD